MIGGGDLKDAIRKYFDELTEHINEDKDISSFTPPDVKNLTGSRIKVIDEGVKNLAKIATTKLKQISTFTNQIRVLELEKIAMEKENIVISQQLQLLNGVLLAPIVHLDNTIDNKVYETLPEEIKNFIKIYYRSPPDTQMVDSFGSLPSGVNMEWTLENPYNPRLTNVNDNKHLKQYINEILAAQTKYKTAIGEPRGELREEPSGEPREEPSGGAKKKKNITQKREDNFVERHYPSPHSTLKGLNRVVKVATSSTEILSCVFCKSGSHDANHTFIIQKFFLGEIDKPLIFPCISGV